MHSLGEVKHNCGELSSPDNSYTMCKMSVFSVHWLQFSNLPVGSTNFRLPNHLNCWLGSVCSLLVQYEVYTLQIVYLFWHMAQETVNLKYLPKLNIYLTSSSIKYPYKLFPCMASIHISGIYL